MSQLLFALFLLLASVFGASEVLPKENSPILIAGAIIAGLIGTFLAFNGRRFFKPFLGIVGFSAGFTISIIIMLWIDESGAIFHDWRIAIPIVIGLAVSGLCLWFLKMAVYCAAAAGGFYFSASLMAIKEGALIPSGWGRTTFMGVVIGVCILLAFFFEALIITVCSAIIGSFATAAAVDVFVRSGFLETALEAVQVRTIETKMTTPAMGIAALFLGMTCAGVLAQYLQGRKKVATSAA